MAMKGEQAIAGSALPSFTKSITKSGTVAAYNTGTSMPGQASLSATFTPNAASYSDIALKVLIGGVDDGKSGATSMQTQGSFSPLTFWYVSNMNFSSNGSISATINFINIDSSSHSISVQFDFISRSDGVAS